jgi:hypothetical protein
MKYTLIFTPFDVKINFINLVFVYLQIFVIKNRIKFNAKIFFWDLRKL